MNKPKILALSGPSSTGKSKLAVEIAKKFDGEIISADSRYVYREMNIATAKPTKEEMQGIPHYLIDICDVTEEYTVGLFVKDADDLIKDITNRGKLPVVTGGTGLYFRSLSGTFDIPEVPADKDFREKAENIPNEILYEELKKKNPVAAEKIHPNNKRKIVRALEIARSGAAMKSKDCPYEILWLGLDVQNRQFLYDRANSRVDIMLESGLFDEAKYLFNKYGENNILMNTIGLKELYPVIKGMDELDFAIEKIKKNTRHYIKRQISWFKGENSITPIFIDTEYIEEKAFEMLSKFV